MIFRNSKKLLKIAQQISGNRNKLLKIAQVDFRKLKKHFNNDKVGSFIGGIEINTGHGELLELRLLEKSARHDFIIARHRSSS